MPELVLSQVSKTFPGGVVALQATDLTVADGECFVLVGPSGAGKSTLLRLVAGLETPDAGTIAIDGRPVNGLPPHQRGVAFVAQRPALYPHLSVAENLAVGLEFGESNRPRRERLARQAIGERVAEAAGWLRLTGLLARRPEELSGGEQQRVALGRAVVRGARLWLLDEPFGHLDPVLRWEFCRELHLLRRRVKTTILYVTHDPIEATALADRIGVLGGGRLLQADTPEVIRNRPGNRTAALCLGWPPMNLIEGRSEPDEGSGFCFRAGAVCVPLPGAWPLHRSLTLGVRPEHLRLGEVGTPGEGIPLGTWEVVAAQPGDLGWLLTLDGPPRPWLGWWREARPVPAGTWLATWVSPDRAHWFDGESGERLPVDRGDRRAPC